MNKFYIKSFFLLVIYSYENLLIEVKHIINVILIYYNYTLLDVSCSCILYKTHLIMNLLQVRNKIFTIKHNNNMIMCEIYIAPQDILLSLCGASHNNLLLPLLGCTDSKSS